MVQGNKESSDIEFYKVTIRELYRNFTNAILKPFHISPVGVVSATEITITEIWMCTLAPITTPLSFIQTVNNLIMYRKYNIKTKETKIKKNIEAIVEILKLIKSAKVKVNISCACILIPVLPSLTLKKRAIFMVNL